MCEMRISHRVLLPLHLDQNSLFGCVATIGKQIILCIKRHNDKDSNDDDGDKNNEKLIRLNRRVNGVRLKFKRIAFAAMAFQELKCLLLRAFGVLRAKPNKFSYYVCFCVSLWTAKKKRIPKIKLHERRKKADVQMVIGQWVVCLYVWSSKIRNIHLLIYIWPKVYAFNIISQFSTTVIICDDRCLWWGSRSSNSCEAITKCACVWECTQEWYGQHE